MDQKFAMIVFILLVLDAIKSPTVARSAHTPHTFPDSYDPQSFFEEQKNDQMKRFLMSEQEEKEARAVYQIYRQTHANKLNLSKELEEADFDLFYKTAYKKLLEKARKIQTKGINSDRAKNLVSKPQSSSTQDQKKSQSLNVAAVGEVHLPGESDVADGLAGIKSPGAAKLVMNANGKRAKQTQEIQGTGDGPSYKSSQDKAQIRTADSNISRDKSTAQIDSTITHEETRGSTIGMAGETGLAPRLSTEDTVVVSGSNISQRGTVKSAKVEPIDSGTEEDSSLQPKSGAYQVTSSGAEYRIDASLSFINKIYHPGLAAQVASLRDNTRNLQTVIHSTRGMQVNSTDRLLLQGPMVVTGLSGPQSRQLTTSAIPNYAVFFCDVTGNALWRWNREDGLSEDETMKNYFAAKQKSDTSADICSAEISVRVSAYQSGCSRQNHPKGCNNLFYKGCSGLTVNPLTNRAIVARTGGRTLGLLSFKKIGGFCQGRIVDAVTHYRGRKFNSPTYAEYTSSGVLYFTDSPLGFASSYNDLGSDSLDSSPLREIPFNGVYLLKSAKNSSVMLADCSMDRPNKIAFSPLEDTMYITNSRKGNSYVKGFRLHPDGSIKNSQIFFNFTAHPELGTEEGYAEGIKVDSVGNVYVVAYKSVYILSPTATLIGVLSSSQRLNDLAFGDGQLFITGEFGMIAQTGDVKPATPVRQTVMGC